MKRESIKVMLCFYVKWSNEQGKEFQEQWMGPKISYPLDYGKIQELEECIFDIQPKGIYRNDTRSTN